MICVWINSWVNNPEAGDLRRYRGHYDVIVMKALYLYNFLEDYIDYFCYQCIRVFFHLHERGTIYYVTCDLPRMQSIRWPEGSHRDQIYLLKETTLWLTSKWFWVFLIIYVLSFIQKLENKQLKPVLKRKKTCLSRSWPFVISFVIIIIMETMHLYCSNHLGTGTHFF